MLQGGVDAVRTQGGVPCLISMLQRHRNSTLALTSIANAIGNAAGDRRVREEMMTVEVVLEVIDALQFCTGTPDCDPDQLFDSLVALLHALRNLMLFQPLYTCAIDRDTVPMALDIYRDAEYTETCAMMLSCCFQFSR